MGALVTWSLQLPASGELPFSDCILTFLFILSSHLGRASFVLCYIDLKGLVFFKKKVYKLILYWLIYLVCTCFAVQSYSFNFIVYFILAGAQ